MKYFTMLITTIFISLSFTLFAEDSKPEISKKEKKQLIDIFGGKVAKEKASQDDKKSVKTREETKAQFREGMQKREAEIQAKMENMTKAEKKQFKQELEQKRAEAKAKMENMTNEEKAAFLREMKKNRKQRSK